MNERHVVNLELSKRLSELGIKRECEFYWEGTIGNDGSEIHLVSKGDKKSCEYDKDLYWIPTYLSSELGEMLILEQGKWLDYVKYISSTGNKS